MTSGATALAHDQAGDAGPPVLLLHAGIADRRMWEPVWAPLAERFQLLRLDLRGFGQSATRPDDVLDHVADVEAVLDEVGWRATHVVAASYGAGVAVELALTARERVSSLLLVTPGGSLIEQHTEQLSAFITEEDAALEAGDLDAAADANVRWWVDGPHRDGSTVAADVRRLVHTMQRRAFELTLDWDDVDEVELDPPALERLGEITAPTLVLDGGLDIDAIGVAARRVADEVTGARVVTWPDVAHVPSLEQPLRFTELVLEWISDQEVVQ